MPNNHSLSAEHRRHDRLLMARFAVGDAGFGQDHEARDLVRRCSECAALAADISAISGTVAKLPAAPRPRDFRLTTEQAAQLRGSRLERWLRTITGSGWATVRPVAAVALSVGLVMSMVGVLPIVGAAVPAPLDTFRSDVGAVLSPQAPSRATDGSPTPGNAMVNPSGGGFEIAGSPEPLANDNLNNPYVQPTPADNSAAGDTNPLQKSTNTAVGVGLPQLMLLIGLALTIVALAVLVLLYAARQRFYDPLLR